MNRAQRRRAPHSQEVGEILGLRSQAASALVAGDTARAEVLFARCLAVDPSDAATLHDHAVTAARRNDPNEAVARFERLLARHPRHPDGWLNLALSLADLGRKDEAAQAARKAVALSPRDPNAHTALGHVLGAMSDLAGAAAACANALAIDPTFQPALLRRARILRQMGETEGSLASCETLLRLRPQDSTADIERGLTLIAADRRAEGETAFRAVLARDPAHEEALMSLSRSLLDGADPETAIAELTLGLRHRPTSVKLLTLRGLLLQRRHRFMEARRDLREAIELDPDDARGYLNMGVLLFKSEAYAEAVLFLQHATRLAPDLVEGYGPLAESHRQLGQLKEAIAIFEHASLLAPERFDLRWMACWTRMHACLWQDYETIIADTLGQAIATGRTISPFMIMAFGLSDLETHLWTRAWAEASMPAPTEPLPARDAWDLRVEGRIRIGYLSGDFRGHATAALVSELFRLQNRGKFELFGYNIGIVDGSHIGREMTAGLDRLVDLAGLDDREAAERIASDRIAILIDLKGYTTDSRPGILAYRAAPVQVNYLGYPGSMGSAYLDYIVADDIVAPPDMRDFFDEAVVRLPHSYQPNDRSRPNADPLARREDHGLPDDGFVFCCFNANYKLTPLVFGIWMRLMREVPGSVLWLLQGNDLSEFNLRAAAAQHGVVPERIVFAPRAGYCLHLARLGLADLFLDTLPVNAHTTASEALWCGVPVLTCMGTHFTSRVAASLLTAVGLPELITTSLADYEREALALALDHARLGALRERLASNRATAPLFDTPRYVRNYEAALERMVELRLAGQPPQAFTVEDHGGGISSSARLKENQASSVCRAISDIRQIENTRLFTGSSEALLRLQNPGLEQREPHTTTSDT